MEECGDSFIVGAMVPDFSTMTRDEMFVKLTTVLSISVLNLSKLNILRSMRSMNRPRLTLKGKRRAIVLREVNSSFPNSTETSRRVK